MPLSATSRSPFGGLPYLEPRVAPLASAIACSITGKCLSRCHPAPAPRDPTRSSRPCLGCTAPPSASECRRHRPHTVQLDVTAPSLASRAPGCPRRSRTFSHSENGPAGTLSWFGLFRGSPLGSGNLPTRQRQRRSRCTRPPTPGEVGGRAAGGGGGVVNRQQRPFRSGVGTRGGGPGGHRRSQEPCISSGISGKSPRGGTLAYPKPVMLLSHQRYGQEGPAMDHRDRPSAGTSRHCPTKPPGHGL